MPHQTSQRGARDDLQALEATLSMGAHLMTPRRGYVHHGIYAGGGRVIHYGGFSGAWRRCPVEEASLETFSGGRRVATLAAVAPRFDGPSVVARARSRLGESRYRFWTNNCEHFCEWCIHGASRSTQVEAVREPARRAIAVLATWLRAAHLAPWAFH